MDARILSEIICSRWDGVHAMPVQNKRDALFDMVFSTPSGVFCIGAKDFVLPCGDELFLLDFQASCVGGWWRDIGVGLNDDWKPRDIKDDLVAAGLTSILMPPRSVRLFTKPELIKLNLRESREIVAVEFKSIQPSSLGAFVVVASQEFPFTLLFGTSDEERIQLLDGLVEVH